VPKRKGARRGRGEAAAGEHAKEEGFDPAPLVPKPAAPRWGAGIAAPEGEKRAITAQRRKMSMPPLEPRRGAAPA